LPVALVLKGVHGVYSRRADGVTGLCRMVVPRVIDRVVVKVNPLVLTVGVASGVNGRVELGFGARDAQVEGLALGDAVIVGHHVVRVKIQVKGHVGHARALVGVAIPFVVRAAEDVGRARRGRVATTSVAHGEADGRVVVDASATCELSRCGVGLGGEGPIGNLASWGSRHE